MAMDWTERAEEMIRNWTGAQQKMWESWLGAMQNIGTTPHTADAWEQTVDTWCAAVRNALETQMSWTEFWADTINSQMGTPPQVTEWSQQLLAMVQDWTTTQMQLSESWFETMKRSNPAAVSLAWDSSEAQHVIEDWQYATQKALEAQMGWIRFWMASQSHYWSSETNATSFADAPPVSEVDAGAPGTAVTPPPPPPVDVTPTSEVEAGTAPETTPPPPPAEVPPVSEVEAGTPGTEVTPPPPPAEVTPASQVDAQPAQGGLVNINTADVDELVTLSGIGPTLARRIVTYREAHGPFADIDALTQVQGISRNTMVEYRDQITV